MIDETSEADEFDCPACGYDLRGSLEGDARFRCPECGRVTSLMAVSIRHLRQKRRRRQGAVPLILGLLALAVLMIAAYW